MFNISENVKGDIRIETSLVKLRDASLKDVMTAMELKILEDGIHSTKGSRTLAFQIIQKYTGLSIWRLDFLIDSPREIDRKMFYKYYTKTIALLLN